MAVTKRARASARAPRRAAAPSHPCCPDASDLVVLAIANPLFEGGTTCGLRAHPLGWYFHQQAPATMYPGVANLNASRRVSPVKEAVAA